ncbi:DUF2147 domain-containing protein [Poseidonocella sedimentorum]|uniref:Uncharacterized conserved protein, DUF2147 family n=1 Tax=Poseidonocella sedimentorum TaxID=871652 RepID=A0A1I6CTW9_9RHOB|nr:DUF2147 domain-containing protein [Poseidonocella sedimentorum]SFQ96628.1 Uncharacterized conserved protein, DUF2147 family [Poseidonocella sedimentorum]
MKSMIYALALGLAGAASADPIEGIWQTQVDDGAYAYVTMAPCGAAFCGTLSRTFNTDGEYKSPNLGKLLVRDMTATGGGKYEGKVWRPSNDKVYMGKMELAGDRLKMKGCVAGGLLCSSQTWARIK